MSRRLLLLGSLLSLSCGQAPDDTGTDATGASSGDGTLGGSSATNATGGSSAGMSGDPSQAGAPSSGSAANGTPSSGSAAPGDATPGSTGAGAAPGDAAGSDPAADPSAGASGGDDGDTAGGGTTPGMDPADGTDDAADTDGAGLGDGPGDPAGGESATDPDAPSVTDPAETDPAEPGPMEPPGDAPALSACGGALPELTGPAFECGDAHVFEDNGPPDNRVNYIIVADGYQASELDTALVEHVENMLYNEQTGMFSEIGEPYTRYRKFINVCALRTASNDSGVDGPNDNPNRDTLFNGGNCGDRLGCVDDRLVRSHLETALPEHIDVDWLAATMNANEWWNSGGGIMVWSGKFMETSATQAASVALHEGGHTFHGLADEYGDEALNCNCASAREPNVACENDAAMSAESKWGEWIGYVMEGGGRLWNLGEHGAVPGGRYCGPSSGVTRPTQDSEMNLLPYAFNMPSLQRAVHDIYEIVRPIDAHTPNDAPLMGATELAVRVVDPAVLKVEWSIDGVVSDATGECVSLAELPSGEHQVQVRVYDDTPWVRDARDDLEQTVEWSVVIP